MIRRKVERKLTTAVVVTVLVIIGIFAVVNIRSYEKSLLTEVERHAIQISQTVKSSTEYDMLLNDPSRIHETVRRLGEEKSIERIRIMNKVGVITYSTDKEEIGKTVDVNTESCIRCHAVSPPLERLEMEARTRVFRRTHDETRALGVITPIYNQPACWTAACHEHPQSQTVLGVFDVVMPLAGVDADLRRSRDEIGVFAISAVLSLSLIIGIFVRRWVSAPVIKLVEATQHVAGGDLSKTIDESRKDELGLLARSFNHMTKKLSEARLQLVQSDKMASLGRLAAGVAHEINNPLTGVLTFSSLMQKRANSAVDQEDLKVIVRETIRCREIVKGLLDFARQSVPTKRESDINEIIQRALAVSERQMALNRVTIEKRWTSSLPKAVVDANQMEQVFMNLIVNAADAIGTGGGTITLSTNTVRLSPMGVLQIRHAVCPKRHPLLDPDVRFDGQPSLYFKVRGDGQEGLVHMDPTYGKSANRHGLATEAMKKVQFLCPECATSLMVEGKSCPLCGGAIFAFESPPRGIVETCSRTACNWQEWQDVDASGDREYIEIGIADTGQGISPENLAKIYEPFFSTKKSKGTGLGLAVVWGIVDAHGGAIAVESEVGKGTKFTIRIPVKP